MKKHTTTLALLVLSWQAQGLSITGKIIDESGQPINNAEINVNGQVIQQENQQFNIDATDADLYVMQISAPGHYLSHQTFSHTELTWDDHSPAKIPAITLVKKQPGRVLMAFGGDVMMGRRYSKSYFNEAVLISSDKANQTKQLVRQIKPYMSLADFAAVNLETQISVDEPKERAPKSVTFYSPPETIPALQWAGVDYVTLGNNHVYDYVDEGLISTLKYLNHYDMAYSGAGINQAQALKPHAWQADQMTYDMLGFVGWKGGFTPNQVAEPEKGGSAFGNLSNLKTTVNQSSQQGHATVVQYHGSLEYRDEPSAMTESRLKTAIDFGADLVIAHHPHVTQGLELYENKLIAYSMGNFVFDQYFHATPLSYLLYVWMDGENFHRAEVVPIYLKGYQPTPATGTQRHQVNQRTRFLSLKRGLEMGTSGGHMSVSRTSQKPQPGAQTITIPAGQRTAFIVQFPGGGSISAVDSKDTQRFRLGVNQVNGGDFETHHLFDSTERSWLLDRASVVTASPNQHWIEACVMPDKPATIGMQTFRRVYEAASVMSFNANIQTTSPVTATLYLQKRKTRVKFFDALSSELTVLGTITLNGSNQQQNIQFDFNLPRVGYRSYRVLLKLSTTGEQPIKAYVDDVALIEWQAHLTKIGTLTKDPELLARATHVGIETPAPKNIELKITR